MPRGWSSHPLRIVVCAVIDSKCPRPIDTNHPWKYRVSPLGQHRLEVDAQPLKLHRRPQRTNEDDVHLSSKNPPPARTEGCTTPPSLLQTSEHNLCCSSYTDSYQFIAFAPDKGRNCPIPLANRCRSSHHPRVWVRGIGLRSTFLPPSRSRIPSQSQLQNLLTSWRHE